MKAPNDRSKLRRTSAIVTMVAMAAAAAAGFSSGLVSCTARSKPATVLGTPVTAAQAQMLAGMRQTNYRDVRSAFRATIGSAGAGTHLTGWVDWRQPLIYLSSSAEVAGAADGLMQAVPGLIAAHDGQGVPAPEASGGTVDPYPPPPVRPPADGWRVRESDPNSPGAAPFDTFTDLLFTEASNRPDDAAALASLGARFVRRDAIGGVPTSVLIGPAVPPQLASPGVAGPRVSPRPSPKPADLPFADNGGQVTYWLDDQGRVLRMEALLTKQLPVTIDFTRTDQTVPVAVDLLGGMPVKPRPVSSAESKILARLRLRDYTAKGGRVSVVVPVAPNGMQHAAGWLDWRTPAAYLSLRDSADPSRDKLLHADRTGVTSHGALGPSGAPATVPADPRPTPDGGATSQPPLPPPATGWESATWAQRAGTNGATDLDLLLSQVLTVTSSTADDPVSMARMATWLRTDTLAGTPVTVYEIRATSEQNVPAGQGRLRYWVDSTGVLRRLEVRTKAGSYGYLDLHPGAVPALPVPITS